MPISQKHGGQKWKFCDKFLILLEATQKVIKKKINTIVILAKLKGRSIRKCKIPHCQAH